MSAPTSTPGAPAIPSSRYAERIERARDLLAQGGGRALLIGVGADLRWLTGYDAHALERLTMLVVAPRQDRAVLVVPRLEVAAAEAAPAVAAGIVDVNSWQETEDPFALVAGAVDGVAADTAGGQGSVLVSDTLLAIFVLRLQAALPGAPFALASTILADLRRIKDAEEIELLRRAAHAADRAVMGVARAQLIGRSEADVAREVRDRLVDEGHDIAAFWIVASGPNSASPHHAPAERVIQPGEPVVLDIGGTIGGYGSDITRTIWVAGPDGGESDPEFRELYDVLQRAQAAATEAVAPGIACESIDATARRIISDGGFGERFIHRTGHGVGLEGHEHPYLVAGNSQQLRVGDAFSVEPGIYLDGRFGARIEDIVVCAARGPDTLNDATRDLLVVAGV